MEVKRPSLPINRGKQRGSFFNHICVHCKLAFGSLSAFPFYCDPCWRSISSENGRPNLEYQHVSYDSIHQLMSDRRLEPQGKIRRSMRRNAYSRHQESKKAKINGIESQALCHSEGEKKDSNSN